MASDDDLLLELIGLTMGEYEARVRRTRKYQAALQSLASRAGKDLETFLEDIEMAPLNNPDNT